MKLIHVTTVPETLRFFTGQIDFLKRQGFIVEAVSSPGPLLEEFGTCESIPVHPVRMLRRITPLQDLVALVHLWRIFRKTKPDIVHGHTPKGGLLAMLAARLTGVPVCIFHIHGLPHLTATGAKAWILRVGTFVACCLAKAVFCVSRTVGAVAVEQGLCPQNKIQVLVNGSSNGIDTTGRFNPERFSNQDRTAIRLQSGIPERSLVIGFVGRMVADKGLCELAASFAEIAETRGDIRLLIAGHPEPHDPLPRGVQLMLQSHPQVHLAGWTKDIASIYACMDMLILPSYREGFPNVLLEAAAMRLPIVTTSVPGCLDAIQPGITGLIVPPKDTQKLTKSICRYIDDSSFRGKHGAAGRDWVERDFQSEPIWSALSNKYKDLLKTVTNESAAVRSRAKRCFDVLSAGVALTLLSPVLMAIAGAVLVFLGRPILFRQVRPGYKSEPFTLLKFRSMRELVDGQGQPRPDCERLTGFGKFLRKTSLDELPALWNVLQGHLSLVGPRPLLMKYLPFFTEREQMRFAVKPGITGWAQIHGRNYSPWNQRLENDLWYVENWTFQLDMKILFRTLGQVLRREGVSPDSYAAIQSLDQERAPQAVGRQDFRY